MQIKETIKSFKDDLKRDCILLANQIIKVNR